MHHARDGVSELPSCAVIVCMLLVNLSSLHGVRHGIEHAVSPRAILDCRRSTTPCCRGPQATSTLASSRR